MKIFRSPLFWIFSIVLILDLSYFVFSDRNNPEISQKDTSEDYLEYTFQDNDNYYWAYIAKNSNPKQRLAKGKWNVSLKGEYLPEDSIHLQDLLEELNGLMGSIELIYTQDSGKYNIDISITTDPEMDKWAEKLNYVKYHEKKHSTENVTEVYFTLLFPDKLTQEVRNSLMKFHLIHSIIEVYTKDPVIFYPQKNGHTGKSFDPKYYEFPENDQKFIKMFYSKHFNFDLFKSSPSTLLTYLRSIDGESFTVYVRIVVYLMLIIYIILAYRLRLIDPANTQSKGLQKSAIAIAFGFGFQSFLIILAYSTNNSLWGTSLIYLLNEMLLILIALYLITYVERLLIKDRFEGVKKIILQVIISLFFLLIPVILPLKLPGVKGILGIGFDGFLYFTTIIVGRAVIGFQKIKIKNAISEKELQLANLQKLQHQSELQAIQSRINPHFLYNSLNSIASLTRIDPGKAEEMALSLSDYFRYSINRKNEKMTRLKDELESIHTYLKIEKIRFSSQLEYNVQCDEALLGYKIPRFLIQPLVENAIKHGTSEMTEKGIIKIEVDIQNEKLIVKVSDNGKDFSEEPIPGFGLQSIYDKLKILYEGEAEMNWTRKPDKAIILSLPYKP